MIYNNSILFQHGNFTVGQEEMKHQMAEIHKLMQFVDPEFCSYLGRFETKTTMIILGFCIPFMF